MSQPPHILRRRRWRGTPEVKIAGTAPRAVRNGVFGKQPDGHTARPTLKSGELRSLNNNFFRFSHRYAVYRAIQAAKSASDAGFGIFQVREGVHPFFPGPLRQGQTSNRASVNTDAAGYAAFDHDLRFWPFRAFDHIA